MVTYSVLVKDFNVFIWINLDGTHNHGYLAMVTMAMSIFIDDSFIYGLKHR